jgi:hypothetical protein
MTDSVRDMSRQRTEVGESRGKVRQIAVPPHARALSMLSDVDYADAFLVEAGTARQWSAEQYARAVLDGTPLALRANLLLGWLAIGLTPAIGRSRSILGWEIRVNTPEYVLLVRDSLIGMPGELLFKREDDGLLFCTFVQHGNLVARAIWASIQAPHVRIVRELLEHSSCQLPQ